MQQQAVQLGQVSRLRQRSLGKIAHQQQGQHQLVGGKGQQKGQQNYPIQPEQPGGGIEKGGTVGKQALPVYSDISQAPDQHPRRSRKASRPGCCFRILPKIAA